MKSDPGLRVYSKERDKKAGILVFLENIIMLLSWAFIGTQDALLCRKSQMKTDNKVV
ncbi:hypothetical protein QYZ88_005035 [Lachnospiraceae bacterium C1.1]|nr:hypothetical protein [Lachnospiraceae bacterium C1.1]